MSLAYYASPIDFQQNDTLESKRKEAKKEKLNLDVLKQMVQPKQNQVQNIHQNVDQDLKDENETILSDFYQKELENDMNKKTANQTQLQDFYQNEKVNTDYLISNNVNANVVNSQNGSYASNQELLSKLNHIIQMFEEQKEIKTNQKNEEVVLYCFLGIFVIYVLDSFVYIGKYKREL